MHAKTPALAILATAAIALAGCASSTPGTGDDGDGHLDVVATTTQLGEFVRTVGGDHVEVTQLLQPGQSVHHFDPSVTAIEALGSADALVINGLGLEPWVDDLIESSGFDGEIIDTSANLPFGPEGAEEGDGHDHGDEEHDHGTEDEHADEEHAEEEHADEHAEDEHDHGAEDGHDHDHGGVDPHTWTSPSNAAEMIHTIGHELAHLDPDHGEEFETNAHDAMDRLEELIAWMHEAIDSVPEADRLLVTNHEGFTAFAAEFHVTIVGAVIPSFEDGAEPSAAEIDELVAAIQETGVQAVFSETTLPPGLAETIAEQAGVQVYTGEDALYADALGAPGTPGETYIGSQIHNTTLIVESWGGTVPEVPDSLS